MKDRERLFLSTDLDLCGEDALLVWRDGRAIVLTRDLEIFPNGFRVFGGKVYVASCPAPMDRA